MKLSQSDLQRFFSKVSEPNEKGCRLWKGSIRNDYGRFKINGVLYSAHCIAWQIDNECDIPDGMKILHKCDVGLWCGI